MKLKHKKKFCEVFSQLYKNLHEPNFPAIQNGSISSHNCIVHMLIYVASTCDIMYASVPTIQVGMRLKLDNSKSREDSMLT